MKDLKKTKENFEQNTDSYKIYKTTLSDDLIILRLINDQGEKIKLSVLMDDYYNFKITKKSRLDINTIHEIQNKEVRTLAYRSALKRLSIKDYSVYKMKESLRNKYDIPENELNELIKNLKDKGLLDDDKYTINRINILSNTSLSLKAIKQKLLQDGISKELIDKNIKEDINEEINKARKKADKYSASIKGKSVNAKKKAIFTKLINDGFKSDDIKRIIEQLDFSKDATKENDLLKLEVEKAYLKYHRKYEGYELKNRIYRNLASKGFNIEKINDLINEME